MIFDIHDIKRQRIIRRMGDTELLRAFALLSNRDIVTNVGVLPLLQAELATRHLLRSAH